MKEILINVSKETRMVDLSKSVIGNDGENLQGKLIFTFVDEFVDGQARLEYEIKGNKNYVVLDKENNTYTIPVKNVITKEGQIDMQLVITEGTDEEEIPVFKSNKFYLFCNSSINAVDEAPDGYELWIEQANIKLNQIDNLDIDIENSIITITKKDGTTKTENVKGEKGEKGDAGSIKFIIVNELPTEDIDESAIYMKRIETEESQNTYEEYIYVNGAWELLGIASVNVDLTDYVKNTDYATSSKAGVVKVFGGTYGIEISGDGGLKTVPATQDDIDARRSQRKPIVPIFMDYAWKVSATTNTEEWTDEEKASARNLIGASPEISNTTGHLRTWVSNGKTGYWADMQSNPASASPNRYAIYLPETEGGDNAVTGYLLTGIPTKDYQCANKKYVDDKFVTLTQAEYDALETKDENTYYYIVEE
jgi:hypothetical protein